MEWLDAFRSHAVALPNLAKFAIVMAIIAFAPALARRFRVPEIVGLLGFGVLLGPYVLDVDCPGFGLAESRAGSTARAGRWTSRQLLV